MARESANIAKGGATTATSDKGNKENNESLTTGGVARSAKLASIPLSAMGRSAVGFGRQMIGQSGELVSTLDLASQTLL